MTHGASPTCSGPCGVVKVRPGVGAAGGAVLSCPVKLVSAVLAPATETSLKRALGHWS